MVATDRPRGPSGPGGGDASQAARFADDTQKLQKVLADAGLGSRRSLETWIQEGRVKVNGIVATIGDRVHRDDSIMVDGRAVVIKANNRPRVLRYNKPAGEVCTRRDPEGRPTIFDNLPPIRGRRWIAVGRLDVNTTGLLMLTDNGELAHRLMHPSHELEREYAVRVYGTLSKDVFAKLTAGVELDDGIARFSTLVDAGGEGRNHWYHVTVQEGRNRLVRRLWESQEVQVSRLTRVRYGSVELPRNVRAGRWDNLPVADVINLMKSVDISIEPARRGSPQGGRRTRAPGDMKRTKTKAPRGGGPSKGR